MSVDHWPQLRAWARLELGMDGMQGEMEALLTGDAMGNAEALMAAGDQPEYEAPEQEEVSLSSM